MALVGTGVYTYLGSLKSRTVQASAHLPTVTKPKFVLPGTMLVIQEGKIFKLSGGTFSELASGNWLQPTLTPDHTRLVAVSKGAQSSDLYLLDLQGHVLKRLTHDDARIIDANHWAYYPRVSPDGTSVSYSYDSPKFGFRVDFAIWTMPLNGTQSQARRRTTPNSYTGGDIAPLPVSSTGLIYVRHSIDPSGVHSQIWLQARSGLFGTPLTDAADGCSQPALSPDGAQMAMICTHGSQTARLEVAPFNGTTLGPHRVLVASGLNAVPTWSPDGKGIAYLAPAGIAGHFELWWLRVDAILATPSATAATATASPATSASPSASAQSVAIKPVQVTQGVDLSATSAPVWY
jgi:Tol biopolymer transport system component